jgi:hypothetical protein
VNQLKTSAQMAYTNPRSRLRWINDSMLARSAKLGPNFFPFSSEWHHLSKQTLKDLFEGLILRLRLTIRNGAHLRGRLSEPVPKHSRDAHRPPVCGQRFRL